MQNGKVKFPSPLDYRKVLMLLLVSLALSLIVTIKDPFRIIEYRQGDIAERNIKSPVDLYLPDKDLTVKKRRNYCQRR